MSDLPENNEWLSPDEVDLLTRFRFPKRQSDWKLGRWTIKNIFALHYQRHVALKALSNIEARAAEDGAPEAYIENHPAPFSISISHSSNVAFCAAASGKISIGCDLEKIEERSCDFLKDYFTEAEQKMVFDKTGEKEISWRAMLIWSAKESMLKILREGLRLDTRSVEVSFQNEEYHTEWAPLSVKYAKESIAYKGWWKIDGDFVKTVVASQPTVAPVELGIHQNT